PRPQHRGLCRQPPKLLPPQIAAPPNCSCAASPQLTGPASFPRGDPCPPASGSGEHARSVTFVPWVPRAVPAPAGAFVPVRSFSVGTAGTKASLPRASAAGGGGRSSREEHGAGEGRGCPVSGPSAVLGSGETGKRAAGESGRDRGAPGGDEQVPVIRHRGSNTLNFEFHDPSPAEHVRAAPRTAGTCPEHPWGACPAPLGSSTCPTRCSATPTGVAAAPIASSPANEWYQTWPAKEAKVPSTPAPTQDPMQGPGAAAPPHPTPSCPRPPGWSATWTKDSKRRERRWVKYDGIGPVDETGMPIASRSVSRGRGAGLCPPRDPSSPPPLSPQSVDRPRDWYRSMFQQIHRKLPGESRCRRWQGAARHSAPSPPSPSPQSQTGTPSTAPQSRAGKGRHRPSAPVCPTGRTGPSGVTPVPTRSPAAFLTTNRGNPQCWSSPGSPQQRCPQHELSPSRCCCSRSWSSSARSWTRT
uniref:SoHo domain-containing protein n=1 Tax=Anser cygnoides TaxID=8845 RepID=A0A8B9IPG2_ANSCY